MRAIPVTIYGYAGCSWCDKATAFFAERDIPYRYLDILAEPAAKRDLLARAPNVLTVPQIFIGEFHLGGHDALVEASADGRLQQLLGV